MNGRIMVIKPAKKISFFSIQADSWRIRGEFFAQLLFPVVVVTCNGIISIY